MLFEIYFYKKDVILTEIVINQGYFSVSKKSSMKSCMVWRAICVGKDNTLRFVAVQKFLKIYILTPRLQWVYHDLTL